LAKPRLSVSTKEVRAAARAPNATGKNAARKGKYNAAGERIDGRWFASAAEARRYEQLKRMVDSGQIERLELQPMFPIVVNGAMICKYKADFRYQVLDPRGRVLDVVVEDVKGMLTDVYVMKKKLVEALHGVKIHELPSRLVGKWEGLTP
jgi:hypothetical protein